MTANILVVGASRGIGLELARQYLEKGFKVWGTCRDATPEMRQLSELQIITGIDVTSEDAVESMGKDFLEVKLDIVICSAGVLIRGDYNDWKAADLVKMFEVNSVAPLRVLRALHKAGKLGKGSKAAVITSRMGSIEDNTSGGYYGYRMSKAALNAGAKSLAYDWQKEGISVAILHPGYVRTAMTELKGNISAQESAKGLIDRIEDMTLETSGTFWHMNGTKLPW